VILPARLKDLLKQQVSPPESRSLPGKVKPPESRPVLVMAVPYRLLHHAPLSLDR
jgi:hypothetical protein